jgi:hypothetical protein
MGCVVAGTGTAAALSYTHASHLAAGDHLLRLLSVTWHFRRAWQAASRALFAAARFFAPLAGLRAPVPFRHGPNRR